jgi:hypothetical protein
LVEPKEREKIKQMPWPLHRCDRILQDT